MGPGRQEIRPDTPDFTNTHSPDAKSDLKQGHGVEALGRARPFILHPGRRWPLVPSGLKDGRCRHTTNRLSRFLKMPCMARPPTSRAKERATGKSLCRISRRSALPVYPHYVPADGTSHRGRMTRTLSPPGRSYNENESRGSLRTGRQMPNSNTAIGRPSPRRGEASKTWVPGDAVVAKASACTRWDCPTPRTSATARGDAANDLLAISEEPWTSALGESKARYAV